ncbi:Hypothetical protein NTJ_12433 [Nesidiocoris tenuis]|uniref:Spaetzle domain-containing protein n=1 Tax=Nesidiocoris tenuis TaxID=355587 RepID=A0ABN7B8Y6_9HEMI|nr:Hypothetical protein NTJ_12433 [Nesidiocoris tenuis]
MYYSALKLLGGAVLIVLSNFAQTLGAAEKCGSDGQQLKYLWGDALTDSPDCVGPNNITYPAAQIARAFRKSNALWGNGRTGRSGTLIDPHVTQKALLRAHAISSDADLLQPRHGRGMRDDSGGCGTTPSRLCRTRYNTTAPMYGVSLTSGQPVTIVQKFPDLLQQVVYEVCESKDCDVVRGECTQTYVPYLFLVIPLGPVTLTGQDYVLVESGCVCKPKLTVPSEHYDHRTIQNV